MIDRPAFFYPIIKFRSVTADGGVEGGGGIISQLVKGFHAI